MTTLDLQGAASLMKIHPVTLGRMITTQDPGRADRSGYVLMERDVLGYIERPDYRPDGRAGRGQAHPGAPRRGGAVHRAEAHPLR
jgi:hypothetical protein